MLHGSVRLGPAGGTAAGGIAITGHIFWFLTRAVEVRASSGRLALQEEQQEGQARMAARAVRVKASGVVLLAPEPAAAGNRVSRITYLDIVTADACHDGDCFFALNINSLFVVHVLPILNASIGHPRWGWQAWAWPCRISCSDRGQTSTAPNSG